MTSHRVEYRIDSRTPARVDVSRRLLVKCLSSTSELAPRLVPFQGSGGSPRPRYRLPTRTHFAVAAAGSYKHLPMQVQVFQTFDEIDGPSSRFRLTCPLVVKVEERHGLVILDCPEFNILSHGRSLFEAQLSFCEDFEVAWSQLGSAEDATLTLDALAIKRKLQALVDQVA